MKVYEAINKVSAALARKGVGKDQTNEFDKYKFRGIDSMYNALALEISKAGLCILPRVLSRAVTERTSQKGGTLFYVVLDVEFDLVAVEDASKHTVKVIGEAMDRGDKATNKAMSAAYKYMAIEVFCIPTEGNPDADAESHTVLSEQELAEAAFQESLVTHEDDVIAIKAALDRNDPAQAASIWFELPEDAKRVLWRAPSKGGPFTTAHRNIMKSREFREAYYGPQEEAA